MHKQARQTVSARCYDLKSANVTSDHRIVLAKLKIKFRRYTTNNHKANGRFKARLVHDITMRSFSQIKLATGSESSNYSNRKTRI